MSETEDMVEVVARVLCDERRRIWNEAYPDKTDDFEFDGEAEPYKSNLRSEARAVIEAYEAMLRTSGLVVVPREPTEAMKDAGRDLEDAFCESIWSAMIDAALKGDSP